MIITISGPPGSGKDTVAPVLLGLLNEQGQKYSIENMGNLRRSAAERKGMTLEKFNIWSKANPQEGDAYFDDFQKKYGLERNNFIMVSRLGWYFIPHSLKIYVDVDPRVGAERIFKQKQQENSRNEQAAKTIEEQVMLNEQRVQSDKERYYALYKINPYDPKNYDVVIDSSRKSAEDVAKVVLAEIRKRQVRKI